jgi:predicted nucleic acid-binding protein
MKYLLDSGILLRLVHPTDPRHREVAEAVALLKGQGHSFYAGMQNVAEFWNVSTRPLAARGGFGLSPQETEQRLRIIERAVEILTESQTSYAEWKRLVIQHRVLGVQVHDTRLAALMNTEGILHLLTLNAADFTRFTGLVVRTPAEVIGAVAGNLPP